MARIEWIKLRLNNWAEWKAREAGGGLGFGSQASFLREAGQDGYRESVVPIDDVDASVTDQAVESLRAGKGHLYATLQCMYVQGLGVKLTARKLAKGESTIKAHLEQADRALSQWFGERADRQKRAVQSAAR